MGQLRGAVGVRGDVPGAAVLHDHDQPEIVGRESLAPGGQSLVRAPSHARQFHQADRRPGVPGLLPELDQDHHPGGRDHHVDRRAGGVRPDADRLLGQPRDRDRGVPELPDPGQPAVHSAVQDHRRTRAGEQSVVPGAAVPDAGGAVLHLDHDRLFQLGAARTGRGGADRRRRLLPDAVAHLHSGGAARRIIAATIFAFTVSPGRPSSIRWRTSIRSTRCR